MPHHLHAIIAFHKADIAIQLLVGNGKGFIAYESDLLYGLTRH
jgi:hypothetical protein